MRPTARIILHHKGGEVLSGMFHEVLDNLRSNLGNCTRRQAACVYCHNMSNGLSKLLCNIGIFLYVGDVIEGGGGGKSMQDFGLNDLGLKVKSLPELLLRQIIPSLFLVRKS